MSANGKWRPEWDALLGTLPDKILARRWGICDSVVGYHRKQLAIPVCGPYPVPCAGCGKPLVRYSGRASAKCLKCRNTLWRKPYDAKWREANRERVREYDRRWRVAHIDERRASHRKAKKTLKRRTDATLATVPCLGCGMFHTPERRRAILLRMLPCHTSEVHEAWGCIWGPAGFEHKSSAGAKRLQRDLREIGAYSRGTRGGYYLPERSAA